MAKPVSERGMKDAELLRSIALPNAAATVVTSSIDLGKAKPFPVQTNFSVKLSTTGAVGVDTKNIVARLQHSDEAGANFTNIAELGTLTVTAAGAAYPAGSMQFSLPPGTKRFIRATAVGESGGGNASNGSLLLELLF